MDEPTVPGLRALHRGPAMLATRLLAVAIFSFAAGHTVCAQVPPAPPTTAVSYGILVSGGLSVDAGNKTTNASRQQTVVKKTHSLAWTKDISTQSQNTPTATATASVQASATFDAISIVDEDSVDGSAGANAANSGGGGDAFTLDTITVSGGTTDAPTTQLVTLYFALNLRSVKYHGDDFLLGAAASLLGNVNSTSQDFISITGGLAIPWYWCHGVDVGAKACITTSSSSGSVQPVSYGGQLTTVAGATLVLTLDASTNLNAGSFFFKPPYPVSNSLNFRASVCLELLTDGVTLKSASGFNYAKNC